jgi:hypothetical protein
VYRRFLILANRFLSCSSEHMVCAFSRHTHSTDTTTQTELPNRYALFADDPRRGNPVSRSVMRWRAPWARCAPSGLPYTVALIKEPSP